MRKLAAWLAAVAALAASLPALAQYPQRPVTLISGFPPGGMVDIVARALAEGIRGAPDGHMFTLAPKSALIIQPQLHELPYKSPDDVALLRSAGLLKK